MLDTKKSVSRMTNDALYQLVEEEPISKTIERRQLQFVGHCIRMDADEPVNKFILYESRVLPTCRRGGDRRTYRHQISSYLLQGTGKDMFEESKIRRMAKKENKSDWKKFHVVPAKKPPDPDISH